MALEQILSGAEMSVGPFGGDTGEPFSYKAENAIRQIIIEHSDSSLEALVFKGDGQSGTSSDFSQKLGGGYKRRTRTDKVEIDFPSDWLTGISGTTGLQDNSYVVKSIKFYTNVTQYGPFGREDGTPFSFRPTGAVLTGFHGRSGSLIDSIGCCFRPLCAVLTTVPRAPALHVKYSRDSELDPGPFGGDGGKAFDDGVFTRLKQIHVYLGNESNVLTGLQFEYGKSNGSCFWSAVHGSVGGEVVKKVVMESEEHLVRVEGFYGPVEGRNAGYDFVRGVSFYTNKGVYGPMGISGGRFFKTPSGCAVIGFFGKAGSYVDAIGVHVEYYGD